MAQNNDESTSTFNQQLYEYWQQYNQLIATQYAENSNAIGYWTNNKYEVLFSPTTPTARAKYTYTYTYNQTPLAYFEYGFDYRDISVFCIDFIEDLERESESEERKLIDDFKNYCTTYARNLYNSHQEQIKNLQNSFDVRDKTFDERNSETQAALQAEVESANGTEENTEQQPQGPQQTTPPESEETNDDVQLSDKAVKIIESGTIDSGAGFLNGDTASSQDSDIIDMIANALGGIAGAALQSSITSATSQLTKNLPGAANGEGSNIISVEELGTDVLTSMEGAAMNVINSSGELANVMDLANTAMNGYETVKNLIKQIPELIPELVLSAVDIITNGILQSIKSNLEAILDPQAIMSQLGYFTTYYTKLYTQGVGDIMSKLTMAQDALGSMQLDANQEKEKSDKQAKLQKHKERIEKCKEYATYAQSAVEAIVYYSTEGVPMVQKLMSTYCQWIVKKADKYITMGADWLIDRRDEFIEDCGEKIGKKAADAINKAVEKASKDKLDAAAVKAKAGLLQGMAMLMMGVQIAVAQLGPLLGKILKIAIKITIDEIKKQIQKAVQNAMKAAIEATQKAIQEASEKATSTISDGMSKATGAISGGN